MKKRILVFTDNDFLAERIPTLIGNQKKDDYLVDYAYSHTNNSFNEKYSNVDWIRPLNIKESVSFLIREYDIIISAHCKQLFPVELVNSVRCINIHPGLNPFNRGWYPQVFSILNGLPCGATIHIMDKELDHGPIIAQQEIKTYSWDTSYSIYMRVLEVELTLLDKFLIPIIENNIHPIVPKEGNINYKADFNKLLEINMEEVASFREHINLLRALSHDKYLNAYFRDEEGTKVYLQLNLIKQAD